MAKSLTTRAALALGTAMTASLMAVPGTQAHAASVALDRTVPPPMSVPTAQYYASHPAAYAQFLAQLPPRGAGPAEATKPRFVTTTGGTWQTLPKAPTGLSN